MVLVQLPLPGGIDQHRVIEAIRPGKDVDGIHPYNLGRLLQGRPDFAPCTPSGIVELLMRNGHDPEGANVVICGRSDIVGKPLAALLMRRGARRQRDGHRLPHPHPGPGQRDALRRRAGGGHRAARGDNRRYGEGRRG